MDDGQQAGVIQRCGNRLRRTGARGLTVALTVTATMVLLAGVPATYAGAASSAGAGTSSASARAASAHSSATAGSVIAPSSSALAKVVQTQAKKRAVDQTLPGDDSNSLPDLGLYEATGDFLGEGHSQVAVVKDDQLQIQNVAKYGGPTTKVDTDLRGAPAYGWDDGQGGQVMDVWQDQSREATANDFNQASPKVAFDGTNIWMVGAKWNDDDPVGTYEDYLYELPGDGSCASQSCAIEYRTLPESVCNRGPGCDPTPYAVVPTSIAVGIVGGRELIAVGMSEDGLYIFNDNFQVIAHIADMGVPGPNPPEQTPVISLAFGPPTGAGQGGLLAVGVESDQQVMFSYRLNPDGSEASISRAGGPWYPSLILSCAVATLNGQQVTVFGESDGTVWVLNPDTGIEVTHIDFPGTATDPTGITPITPWDGSSNNQQLVVGTRGGIADHVLQYDAGVLKPLGIGENGATTVTNDQLYDWYPGYGAGRLQVANDSPRAVSVSMYWRPLPDYGCWLNASIDGGPSAFPTNPTLVDPALSSATYVIAALTAGTEGQDGNCASGQEGTAGERSAYLVITPYGDPADEHLVKLKVGEDESLTIPDQVGGYLTATVRRIGQADQDGSWGAWRLGIGVSGSTAPLPTAAPSITGTRLTAPPGSDVTCPLSEPVADDPCRPVYRFDVTGAQWKRLGAAGQVTATIPAMEAEGSVNGQDWQDLGQLMPATTPSRQGDTVTLGPSSFFYQDAFGAQPLEDVRVVSGGLISNVEHLADLPAPPIGWAPEGVSADGIKLSSSGPAATPLANGVDQAALKVDLTRTSSNVPIDADNPLYNLVYYRDADDLHLITGLYNPDSYDNYVGVDPDLGQTDLDHSYVVTTTTDTVGVEADLNVSGTATPAESENGDVVLTASLPNLQVSGTGTTGISASGCLSGNVSQLCPLDAPTPSAPALYQAGSEGPDRFRGPPETGLELDSAATTSASCLPLDVLDAHNIASQPLNFHSSTEAVLSNASAFLPSDRFDTAVVASGNLVLASAVPVSSSPDC